MQTTVTAVTYTMSMNNLSTKVYQLPYYLNKNSSISSLPIGGNPGGLVQNNNYGSSSSIYDSDVLINTG